MASHERHGVSYHRQLGCLFKHIKANIKETPKLRTTGLCEGNPPMTGRFSSQRASDMKAFSCHDVMFDPRLIYYCVSIGQNCDQKTPSLFRQSCKLYYEVEIIVVYVEHYDGYCVMWCVHVLCCKHFVIDKHIYLWAPVACNRRTHRQTHRWTHDADFENILRSVQKCCFSIFHLNFAGL